MSQSRQRVLHRPHDNHAPQVHEVLLLAPYPARGRLDEFLF